MRGERQQSLPIGRKGAAKDGRGEDKGNNTLYPECNTGELGALSVVDSTY